jgi:hypothetical protein
VTATITGWPQPIGNGNAVSRPRRSLRNRQIDELETREEMRAPTKAAAVIGMSAAIVLGLAAAPAQAATKNFTCADGNATSDDRGYLYGIYSASGTSSWRITEIDYQIFIGNGIRHGNSTDVFYTDNANLPATSYSTGSGRSDGVRSVLTTSAYSRPRFSGSRVNFKFIFDHSLAPDPSCSGTDNYPSS